MLLPDVNQDSDWRNLSLCEGKTSHDMMAMQDEILLTLSNSVRKTFPQDWEQKRNL